MVESNSTSSNDDGNRAHTRGIPVDAEEFGRQLEAAVVVVVMCLEVGRRASALALFPRRDSTSSAAPAPTPAWKEEQKAFADLLLVSAGAYAFK